MKTGNLSRSCICQTNTLLTECRGVAGLGEAAGRYKAVKGIESMPDWTDGRTDG